MYEQELISSKATKEHATTVYARVLSKSKLLASELPNMETCSSVKRHNDDIKTHVFCGSDVRNLTLTQWSAFDLAVVKWPSERVIVKAICHKNVVDLKIPGPLTVWRRLLIRSGGSSYRPHDAHCALPKQKYVSNLDLNGTGVTHSFAASPLISSWYEQQCLAQSWPLYQWVFTISLN